MSRNDVNFKIKEINCDNDRLIACKIARKYAFNADLKRILRICERYARNNSSESEKELARAEIDARLIGDYHNKAGQWHRCLSAYAVAAAAKAGSGTALIKLVAERSVESAKAAAVASVRRGVRRGQLTKLLATECEEAWTASARDAQKAYLKYEAAALKAAAALEKARQIKIMVD
jgi:hypothetical protein